MRLRKRPEATQKKQQQAGREASWLKEVRKVKRVGKSKKWVTRPRGGRSKQNFGETNCEQTRMK